MCTSQSVSMSQRISRTFKKKLLGLRHTIRHLVTPICRYYQPVVTNGKCPKKRYYSYRVEEKKLSSPQVLVLRDHRWVEGSQYFCAPPACLRTRPIKNLKHIFKTVIAILEKFCPQRFLLSWEQGFVWSTFDLLQRFLQILFCCESCLYLDF